MVNLSDVKWSFLKNVFIICALIIFVTGRQIYHEENENKDQNENDSELYFNGAEKEKTDDPLSKITENDLPRDGEVFEGDMIMDKDLRRAVLGEEDKRSAIYESELEGKKHWKDGIVPYALDDSLVDEIRDQIPHAVKAFAYYTCIKLVPKNDSHVDFVVIRDGDGCSSSVGRKGGQQSIHLAKGCHRFGTILHEIMHALGIIHEQSRPDRDTYVEVRYDNIKRKLLRNFQKYDFGRADNLDTDYNYNSVMHYSNYAFSDNGDKTLVSKFDKGLVFGQRIFFSILDIKEINTLYKCEKKQKHPPRRLDLLYGDMTAKIILKRKKDQLRDETKLREFFNRYL